MKIEDKQPYTNRMTRKKLCILALSMGSGGAEKTISLLLPFLIKKYHVTLVLFATNTHFKVSSDIEVIFLQNEKSLSFIGKILSFPVFLWKYIKILKNKKADISLSFLTRPNIINGISSIFMPKVKTVLSERCYPSKAYRSARLRYLLYRFLIPSVYNRADVLFSNSIHINNDLIENFGVTIPTYVVYNPVELPNRVVGEAGTCEGRDKLTFNIINVGSIYPIKNQALLLRALRDSHLQYKLTFAGDGVMRDDVIRLAEEFKIAKNVEFLGRIVDVNSYLIQNDCFVLSSNSEGFPNVILEAMAVGLPIISTNCLSGPLEILNDNVPLSIEPGSFNIAKYGILVNVNDDVGLRAAIEFLASNISLRQSLSSLSLERARAYKTDIVIEKLYNVLD